MKIIREGKMDEEENKEEVEETFQYSSFFQEKRNRESESKRKKGPTHARARARFHA